MYRLLEADGTRVINGITFTRRSSCYTVGVSGNDVQSWKFYNWATKLVNCLDWSSDAVEKYMLGHMTIGVTEQSGKQLFQEQHNEFIMNGIFSYRVQI